MNKDLNQSGVQKAFQKKLTLRKLEQLDGLYKINQIPSIRTSINDPKLKSYKKNQIILINWIPKKLNHALSSNISICNIFKQVIQTNSIL
jgi:hypothetical protein